MQTKTRKIKKITTICLGKVLLLSLFLTGLNTAFAVDFVTKAQFEAEKSTYKDYPFKLLFKKLAEGDAAEKRIITNTIILKQAFDRHMQEKIKGGIVNYKETFGIIKDIGKDHLKLWIPKTDSIADFYLGIDRIPIINDQNYQVTESNIGKYAAVIYSLDDRIYQIKISFQPASPTGLAVKREDGKNIVSWNRPTADQKPVGYKLFINEEPFERVDEPVIKVPRTIGQADEYHVKAIYKHGDSFIESDASDIQVDEITAKEVQREILAWETYDRIVAALTPSQWQAAEKLLYDNQPFLSEHLNAERKQNIARLSAFFADIDEGNRHGTAMPASLQNLEAALQSYQLAETKAKTLPAGIDVLFIPRLKIGESQQRLARLQSQQKELLSGETYGRIVAALNPAEWQSAEKLLYDNQPFLSEHLDAERKQNVARLSAFFAEIGEGDRLGSATPASLQNLESALMFYQRAEQKAKTMPAGIDVLFIPRLKIGESQQRLARLQSRQKELSAGETYDRIIAALTPAEWQTAEKLLYDNQPFLSEQLDAERKQNIARLSAFFAEIDEGNRLGSAMPASLQNLEAALQSYQLAETKAKTLPAGIDVLFIPRLKIGESQQHLARLQSRQKELSAGETYDRIIAAINPAHWRSAEKLLYDNQQFLSESLDEKRKLIITGLIAFFTEIDEGDRLGTATPDSVQNLKSALMFYQRAETKAKALPSDIDVQFVPRLKIDESQQRLAQLEIRQKELAAGETYNRIITALNPSRWQDAEKLLYDNQQFLSEHLDQERKQNTAGLSAFFAEVDEGDRLSRATPESIQTLESALMFYQRAETKAKALPAAIDVMFIPRLKLDESQQRLAKLKAPEKELVAVRNAKTEAITPSKAPQPSEKILDSDTETKVAMKNFMTRDYTSALHHFENIYGSQIANLKQSGDKQIRGLLSLPIKHRAEVIFLIELDRLKKENNNDEELIKQGLEMIYQKIDSGEGLWSIIPESKRKTIKRHIEKYGS